jgi:peptidoglycan L-alanyl-D-glutamate endopeptidase CwlK
MSYKYGKSSKDRLVTCHPEIQRLFNSLIEHYDISILCGYRDEEAQSKVFKEGKSTVVYPNGKHNSQPSLAIDAGLYPIDWSDKGRWYMFIGIVKERARQLGIKVRCGGDWASDLKTSDQTFHDLPHVELIL